MDDFELYEELGKGNYGTVQKVWHKPTKVTMALKVSSGPPLSPVSTTNAACVGNPTRAG